MGIHGEFTVFTSLKVGRGRMEKIKKKQKKENENILNRKNYNEEIKERQTDKEDHSENEYRI